MRKRIYMLQGGSFSRVLRRSEDRRAMPGAFQPERSLGFEVEETIESKREGGTPVRLHAFH